MTDVGRGTRLRRWRLAVAGLTGLVLSVAPWAASAEDQPVFRSLFDPAALAEWSDHHNPLLTEPGRELMAPGDWPGLARDTAFLLGYQLLGVGIFYVLPESISQWSDEQKENASLDRWWENVQNPTWDKDTWWINAGHAYFGAAYYIRARERGFGEIPSFLYSALASALYEFGIEAFFEQPSYQDLIITPVGGALLGAFVFEPIRRVIRAQPKLRWYDHVLLVLSDPLGAGSYVIERLIGIKSEIRVDTRPPAFVQVSSPSHAIGRAGAAGEYQSRDSGVSIEFRMRWD